MSFHRRPLPDGLVPFASPQGRTLFAEALADGTLESWFPLAEHFHTQAEPTFCGLGSLVMALNALEIDPARPWKGPWRWFSEELLDCCKPLDQVRELGMTLDEVACLARCNGAEAAVTRSPDVHALREAIGSASRRSGVVLVANYARTGLGQTGTGHFSPIAGWHSGRDLVLVLDVARFKYPPHWVPVATLHGAMTAVDPDTGRPRGWITLRASTRREGKVVLDIPPVVWPEHARALRSGVVPPALLEHVRTDLADVGPILLAAASGAAGDEDVEALRAQMAALDALCGCG